MSREPLVSIVTPCYNGAAYVDRFFETVMDQTWPHIELIFVDDGSTDDTLAKAEAWRERLEARGITFKLLTHPNGGQASAINVGLPHVTGKYVMWPDSDDLMDPKNVELKARYLEGHPEKGLVVCDVACVDEDDLGSVVRSFVFDDSRYRLFDSLIREEKGAFCSGIAYLHELLSTYVVRSKSHSHSYISLEDQMRRTYELEDIILQVLPAMGMEKCDFEKYMGYARVKYLPTRFDIAVKMGDKDLARDQKARLDAAEGRSVRRDLVMAACEVGLAPMFFSLGRRVKGTARRAKAIVKGK